MPRPIWFRAVVAIWSLWFGAVLSEPGALHTCPMHGSHAAHMAGMHHESGGHPGRSNTTHCTCLGDCCCFAPAGVPATTVAVDPAARVVRVAPRIAAAANPTPVAAPPHSRPFANGPPAALLG